MSYRKSVVIIILNFNGYKDTIECLSSICKIDYPTYKIILIDNGSTDRSVQKIFNWCHDKFRVNVFDDCDINDSSSVFPKGCKKYDYGAATELTIIKNIDNIGFATGCNQGMKLALSLEFDYIWLLNNDTIITPDSLSIMAGYLDKHLSCQVTTPQIRLYGEPDKIWNCGGLLKWYGIRKYHFVHKQVSDLPQAETLDVTFITGCAPLIRSTVIETEGMFSEKFFFGEEDFEFSLRMKRARKKMVCCLNSIIYHKVGSSIVKVSDDQKLGKIYLHYLNRFINLRNHYPLFFWHCWRIGYIFYIYLLLGKQTECSVEIRYNFIKKLLKDSSKLDGVDKKAFLSIIHSITDYLKEQ